MTGEAILSVRELKTWFHTTGGIVKAVDGVSFDLHRGETLGIVGESGSGKSVTNLSILRLIQSPPGHIENGEVIFEGRDLLKLSPEELRTVRGGKIAMIFQDPMTSLNPYLRISTQMIETIRLHQGLDRKAARNRAIDLLGMAGIPMAEKRLDQYPHQFSGGMQQRVMIALALSCDPEILIADEPTSALDVTIQAQILDLIKDLNARLGMAVILISHSLGVVAGLCDTICVMYSGRIVERGSAEDLFTKPSHPYTQGLIKAVPRIDKKSGERLFTIPGQPADPVGLGDSCAFHPRCDRTMKICTHRRPGQTDLGKRHTVSCWLHQEGPQERPQEGQLELKP